MIADWQRIGYGWMGRTPDYKAAFFATLSANAEYCSPFQENARQWYRKAQEYIGFAEECMSEYDLDGWNTPDLINPDDVNYFTRKKL